MKKLIFIFLIVNVSLFTIHTIAQPCLPQGIIFETQSDIDSFQSNYPDCTEIEGDVGIGHWWVIGSDITNLEGLNVLTSIGGSLIIKRTPLPNLTGLENLTSLGGDLIIGDGYIGGNWNLTSLAGLNNLSTVGGSLHIAKSSQLPDLSAISNFTSIGGDLFIYQNDTLSTLTGLNNITSIGGDLRIEGNPSLVELTALNNITSIGGDIRIQQNANLLSLDGLENINPESIQQLYIYRNNSLASCNAESICSYLLSPGGSINIYDNTTGCNNPVEIANACGLTLDCLPFGNYYFLSQNEIDNFQTNFPTCNDLQGDVYISGEDITDLIGLSSLISIEGSLVIGEGEPMLPVGSNPILTSLAGLENISGVGGNLGLSENNVLSDLTALINLSSVDGNIQINNNDSLKNLVGFNSLSSISGNLQIFKNASLTSLSGLENLMHVDGHVHIGDTFGGNVSLINLIALENLNSINGNLRVSGNDLLTSLSGLENLNPGSINNLKIYYNNNLSFCEVQSLCDYLAAPNGSIDVHDNAPGCNSTNQMQAMCNNGCLAEGITFSSQEQIDSFQINYPDCRIILGNVLIQGENITNLNGLNSLTSCYEDLVIRNNASLMNLSGLDSLTSVGEHLNIYNNENLNSFVGLSNLTSIGKDLFIQNNSSIINLAGLEQLSSIGNYLTIKNNNSLIGLTGLENLTVVGGLLNIRDNQDLLSLSGIENINPGSIENLGIIDNESLSTCHVQSICDFLATSVGIIQIEGNAPGCSSIEEVEEACWTSVDEISLQHNFTISPNPIESSTIIKYTIRYKSPVTIKIFDMTGQEIKTLVNKIQQQGKQQVVFNTSGLPAGIYFCTLNTINGIKTKKMIKL